MSYMYFKWSPLKVVTRIVHSGINGPLRPSEAQKLSIELLYNNCTIWLNQQEPQLLCCRQRKTLRLTQLPCSICQGYIKGLYVQY